MWSHFCSWVAGVPPPATSFLAEITGGIKKGEEHVFLSENISQAFGHASQGIGPEGGESMKRTACFCPTFASCEKLGSRVALWFWDPPGRPSATINNCTGASFSFPDWCPINTGTNACSVLQVQSYNSFLFLSHDTLVTLLSQTQSNRTQKPRWRQPWRCSRWRSWVSWGCFSGTPPVYP